MEEDFPDIELPDDVGDDVQEAVPVSAPQRAMPAQQPVAQQESGGFDLFESLGAAISAGLQGLQEMFGLSDAQAAVPDPRGQNMQGATAMFRGAGAYSGEEMKAIRKAVDPEDKLTEGVANLAGLMNAYESFSARGDAASAKKMAASIIQYSQQRSIALGGLALEALKDGNYSDGAKALVQAFNVIPNGQQVSIEKGVGVVRDMKTGETVKEIKLTPQVMIAAAGKLASGEDYYKMLIDTASGKMSSSTTPSGLAEGDELKRYQEAEASGKPVNTQGMSMAQLKSAIEYNRNVRFTAGEQGKNNRQQSQHDFQSGENQKNRDLREHLKQLAIDATSENTDKRVAASKELAQMGINARTVLKQMGIDANKDLQDDRQDFTAGENAKNREAAQTRVNTQQAGATERTGMSQAGATERTKLNIGSRESEGAANRASREGIAAGAQSTSRQNTLDRIDATAANKAIDIDARDKRQDKSLSVRESEGAANRKSREGIAAGAQSTSRQNTLDRIDAGAANKAIDLDARSQRQDKSLGVRMSEGAANRAATRQNTLDRIDASAAKQSIDLNARNERQATGINARVNAGRQRAMGKELEAITKMTDHEVLGVDETMTPKVSAGQAQVTRTIARNIIEGVGSGYRDQGLDAARKITAWDAAARRPKYQIKLNQSKDGYSITLPDGTAMPVNENAFREIQKLRQDMGAR